MLHIVKTAIYVQMHVISHDRPQGCFIKIILAWLFDKGSSEGVVVGGRCKSSCDLGSQSRNMLPFTKKKIENQIIRIKILSILRIK